MKRWVDMTGFLKRYGPTRAFDFFTYTELVYWFVFCVAINPFRWKWAMFVFFGLGKELPFKVVQEEDRLRNLDGVVRGRGVEEKETRDSEIEGRSETAGEVPTSSLMVDES